MAFDTRFRILAAGALLRRGSQNGAHLREALQHLAAGGHRVVEAESLEDAANIVQADAALGCLLLEWSQRVPALIETVRARGAEMPIFLVLERQALKDVGVKILGLVTGTIFIAEDMPDFIAKNIASHVKLYADSLKTPFFGALADYADAGNQMWTCPGHNGGIFYWKSPVGRLFVEHLGEAVFRADIDNSVVEMGDLLIHEGPALAAQQAAAEIFGAERTYFVLNGTSTSNKVVASAIVAQGDLVLFDRNNHKSNHHGALVLAGGIPIYLETARNAHGLIGPIDYAALDESYLRDKIKTHPLVRDPEAWRRKKPFRIAIIEQCSYDGTIYSAEMVYEKLSPLCDYILFDEAWAGFMKFHPLFHGRYGMGIRNPRPEDAGIIVTQSTHKQLAGFSQASQIHVRDAHAKDQKRHVTHRRFNDAFMLHASTSPFYPLFASLDVGAQMMKGRAGEVLWDDTIRMGIELRKKIREIRNVSIRDGNARTGWFFDPFVPDVCADGTQWEQIATDELARDAKYWEMGGAKNWHGFGALPRGWAMTDPNKLTLLTPGIDRATGEYEAHGIPAAILAEFLREQNIVPEKNDFNSILFLLTPGLEASKAGTLLSALLRFKTLHDENAPLARAIPAFFARHAARYAGVGLYDLAQEMHDFYRINNVQALQKAQFRPEHFPVIAMSPQAASQAFVRDEVDYLPLAQIEGRVAATLALVYPPGIGVIVPGERYDERARPMLDYLKMFEDGANRFPGFESEIQGVYHETMSDGRIEFRTYVVRDGSERRDQTHD